MASGTWRSGQVLAWTDRDGPGRPPKGPAVGLTSALAIALAVAHIGMLSTDTLCPEHRAWVFGLAVLAIVSCGFAVVGLLRGWASSALLTVLAAGCGVVIGAIDTAHDPSRGQILIAVFAVVGVAAALLSIWNLRLRRWEHRTVAGLRPVASERSLPQPQSAGPAEPSSGIRHGARTVERAGGST